MNYFSELPIFGTTDTITGWDCLSNDALNLTAPLPTGKLVFQVIGAVAEFECNIISEEVKAGLRNARRKGKRLGRPPVSPMLIKKARTLRDQGLSYRKIGKKLGIFEGWLGRG